MPRHVILFIALVLFGPQPARGQVLSGVSRAKALEAVVQTLADRGFAVAHVDDNAAMTLVLAKRNFTTTVGVGMVATYSATVSIFGDESESRITLSMTERCLSCGETVDKPMPEGPPGSFYYTVLNGIRDDFCKRATGAKCF